MDVTDSALEYFLAASRESRADAGALWKRFHDPMRLRAERWLRGLAARGCDADDVVVSAFLTLWNRRRAGEFSGIDSTARLYGLLARIIDNKARNVLRRGYSLKRGAGRVRGEGSALRGESKAQLDGFREWRWAPEEMLVAADTLIHLLQRTDPLTQQIVCMKLRGDAIDAIAGQLDRSVSTVWRKLRRIESEWAKELQDE